MASDRGQGRDAVGVGAQATVAERGRWLATFTIEKFDAPIEWYADRVVHNEPQDVRDRVYELARKPGGWHELDEWVQHEAKRLLRANHTPEFGTPFHNNLLNTGINTMWNLVLAAGTTNGGGAAGANAQFTNAQTRLAIGDSSTAFSASQTWLQASSNKYAQVMDATYPSIASQTITFRVTVTGGNANYSWQEFCTDNAGNSTSTSTTLVGGSSLNRAVSNQGTKASGQTWTLTETITLS